jgi:hypothetical protein
MTTYADPTRCPDCHAVLPHDPQVCRVCSLPLTGQIVVSLFTTLQEADRLLGALRAQKRPVPVAAGVTSAAGSHLAGVERYPSARSRPAADLEAPRLRGTSVPKILLSLGALCLLVAAVTFLAVAWSWLGVGGRTVVLVGLTGTALGFSVALHHRGLQMASEALSVIGLGLLALDVAGVRNAGWLGQIDDARLVLLTGATVATGALVMLLATSRRRPLVAPALIAPVAVLVAGFGAQLDADPLVPLVVTVIVLIGLGRVGTLLPSVPLQVTSLATGCLGWLTLVVAGVTSFEDLPLSLAHYAGQGAGWPLLAATLLAAGVGPATGVGRGVTTTGYAVAGLAGTYTALMPVLDNAGTAMQSALLVASVLWVGAVLLAPRSLRPAALLPLAGTLVVPAVAAARLAESAACAVLTVGSPFSQPFGVHVATQPSWISPLLLVPTLVTLAAAGCAAARLAEPVRRSTWGLALGGAALLGGMTTLPLYDVPLAVVVTLLVVAAVAGVVAAERLAGSAADATRLGVLLLTAGAALLALPSDRMTTLALTVACALAAYLMSRTNVTGAMASVCLPLAFAGLVWAGGNAVGVDEQLRAVPVLLVLGALALWRPRLELEVSSVVAGTLVSIAAIATARDLDTAVAVHVTIAGVLVTASSIIHPSRRLLAWPGGLLLAAATWVRLLDLGVHVPEAYTLPSALVLVIVGGWRLREDDRSATLTYLAPGLSLATVPSLVAMLGDPSSLRALLLGLACLVLTLGGAARRWSAPLVVGASVGTLLVLRELAPYAAGVPSWLTIGSAGGVLLLVGITWERRMNDVRRAAHFVAALR